MTEPNVTWPNLLAYPARGVLCTQNSVSPFESARQAWAALQRPLATVTHLVENDHVISRLQQPKRKSVG
jgi:hypothetical protein